MKNETKTTNPSTPNPPKPKKDDKTTNPSTPPPPPKKD